jgi:hypothetical protein
MQGVIDAQKADREQADSDARAARELAEAALDRSSDEYRNIGPDILLGAAEVYATLATRRYR